MKIYSVNSAVTRNMINRSQQQKRMHNTMQEQNKNESVKNVSFKSDEGCLLGMAAGALVGLGATALVIATGGLAAPIAAVGVTGVATCGTAAGANIGGIIGGLASGPEK